MNINLSKMNVKLVKIKEDNMIYFVESSQVERFKDTPVSSAVKTHIPYIIIDDKGNVIKNRPATIEQVFEVYLRYMGMYDEQ